MPTTVLVLAYPTFVEIDLNEVRDNGKCNDEVQTWSSRQCDHSEVMILLCSVIYQCTVYICRLLTMDVI